MFTFCNIQAIVMYTASCNCPNAGVSNIFRTAYRFQFSIILQTGPLVVNVWHMLFYNSYSIMGLIQ